MVLGLGMNPVLAFLEPPDRLSSSRTSWQRSMQRSQMYTPGPATSLRTWSWPFPQNEQRVYRRRSSDPLIEPLYVPGAGAGGLWPRRISLARLTHSLQMYTPDPAINCTPPSPRSLPQKEHRGRCRTTLASFPLRRKIIHLTPAGRLLAVRNRHRSSRRRDDVVDQPVGLRLLGRQEVVALGVLLDPLYGLAGVLGQDPVEDLPRAQDLLGVDLDVGRLALHPAPRLVNQDVGVGEGGSPA